MAQVKPVKRAKQTGRSRFGGTLPTTLYERVKVSAKQNKRQIQGQIEYILERYFQQEDASGNAA